MEKKLSFRRITDSQEKLDLLKEAADAHSELYLSDGIHQWKTTVYSMKDSLLQLRPSKEVTSLFSSGVRLTLNIAHQGGILFSMAVLESHGAQALLEVDEDILVIQRRAAYRAEVPKVMPCFFELSENNTSYILPVMDISMTGAQLWSESYDLDMSQEYSGHLRLTGENQHLPVKIIVRRDSVTLGLSVYGVEFIEPSHELSESIQRFLLKVYRSAHRQDDQ